MTIITGAVILACGEDATGPTIVSVEVTPASATLVFLGETVQLTATARDASGSSIPGKTFTWSSSDEAVAVVNVSGLVTAEGNGSATITATSDGVSGTAMLGVLDHPLLISAGGQTQDSHTCSLTDGGSPRCWGKGSRFGQLGTGSNVNSSSPVPVLGNLTFQVIEAGGYHTCGITDDDQLYCWGYNRYGQLGDGTTTTNTSPVAFAGGVDLVSVRVGGWTSCAITAAGSAYCWGWGARGERGDGIDTEVQTSPSLVAGRLTFTTLVPGAYHTCGITSAGLAYCWGNNTNGQVGATTSETCGRSNVPCAKTPVAVATGLTFRSISPGGIWPEAHTCGVAADGSAHCWGANSFGQVGDGSTVDRAAPAAVSGGLSFSSVSAGGSHSCGLTNNGTAYCWGENAFGQLGNGSTSNSSAPMLVAGGLTFTLLDAGASHTCSIAADGATYCWGRNNDGQVGDGTTTDRSVPVLVSYF